MTGRRTHGHSRSNGGKSSPTFMSWLAMRNRCYNPKNEKYSSYGGKGITVCQSWRDSFTNFLSDMGIRPEKTTLDRKDGTNGYSPDNCRWATSQEQIDNRNKHNLGWKRNNTHCPSGHEFDERNTRFGPTGRKCRTCERNRARNVRSSKRVCQ